MPAVVEVLDSGAWSALKLSAPTFRSDLVVTPVLGVVDALTGAVTDLREISGIVLNGGLTAVR